MPWLPLLLADLSLCPTFLHLPLSFLLQYERDRVYDTMANHDGAAIAVIQTQSGGIARSLATAKHVMFASRGFSFVNEEQARDRVFAPGVPRVVYGAAKAVRSSRCSSRCHRHCCRRELLKRASRRRCR